ncbi:cytochrome P450 [Enterobacter cloacae]|uniref:cytochrome P450 n=1 Tax=Enterobacter cloacae TaxID=550 RepID=UPI0021CE66A8|nr:cytochrome P450 [Enterobacter cloacae]MCU6209266.1 cytochrome P450 [Enterobacter cloacae]
MDTQIQVKPVQALSDSLLSLQFNQSPYRVYSELRKHNPVFWSEEIRAWMITRYDDVMSCLHDERISANRIIPRIKQFPAELQTEFTPLLNVLSMWPLMLDRPEHTRLRALINKAMVPGVITSFIPLIKRQAEELLNETLKNDCADIIESLALPYPLNVVSEIIGVRKEDRPQLKAFAVDIVNFFGCAPGEYTARARAAMQAVNVTSDILRITIQQRRKEPKEDLITALIKAEENGDILSEEEIIATCLMMVFAGFETTTNLIGNGLLLLLQHPEQLQRLRENPALMPAAIREMLRFESPVQRLSRMAREDFILHGKRICKGDLIFLIAASANRDEATFTRPDTFDISRDARNHLAFGHSIHLCPGNNLAQLETQILFEALLTKTNNISLLSTTPEWQKNLSVRSLLRLPVAFN